MTPAVKARARGGAGSAARCCSFPTSPFALADGEKQFLDARVSDGKAKNI